MDLVERYLAAIGRQLPPKQAADITAELRDVLMNRIEEREDAVGRPLDRAGTEALLKDFGHPLVVAARYRKTQQLIGPEVYPFWLTTVRWTMLILAIVYVTLMATAVLLGRTTVEIGDIGSRIVSIGFMLVGIITTAFAAFEQTGKTAFLRDWKPSRLPPAGMKGRSRFSMVTEMVMDVVFIAWWLGLFRFRDVVPMPYPGFLTVEMAPVWMAWRWAIVAYAAVEIAANAVALARPAWIRTNMAVLTVRYLAGVGILIGILQAGHWLVVGSPTMAPDVLATVQANFDLGMRVGIGLTILGMAIRVGLEAWRLRRLREADAVGAPQTA